MIHNEALLIKQLKNNDVQAINTFVDKYAPQVYSVIMGYVKIHEDAEELCDDVFITSLKKLESFNSGSSLLTWLTRIAINKSLDFLKSKKTLKNRPHHNTVEMSMIDGDTAVSTSSKPINREAQRDQHIVLYASINCLSDRQRTAILLQLSNKMSNEEIAEIMRTTIKSVEGLLRRARLNLKRILTNHHSTLFAEYARGAQQ